MKCDRCQEEKEDVIIVIDPYIKQMSGEEIKIALCDECYTDRIMSV